MDNALERFFNKIDFNNRETFKDAKVVKVVVNNKNDSWEVYIHAPSFLDINALNELSLLASKGIEDVSTINIIADYDSYSDDDVKECFLFYLNSLCTDNPSLMSLVDGVINISDRVINMSLSSRMECDLLSSHASKLLKLLSNAGFKGYEITSIVSDEASSSVKKEIQKREEPKIKEEPQYKVIVGEEIKSKTITEIKDILGEENNVTCEAYIFGVEEFVSNKSNFRILTLKISDKTDSILAKIFLGMKKSLISIRVD